MTASYLTKWRTRADPEWTASCGVEELHVVLFQSNNDRGGPRDTIAVSIPEAPRHQIRLAIKQANKRQARLFFVCDTREQADQIARYAAKRLPAHHRMSYKRAEAGAWARVQ